MLTFVGDVHGWMDRLEVVLSKARGELVFVGDLIDRGPNSAAVVHRVRALCDEGRAACIMGNHEYALVRGLGIPELGIPAHDELLEAWIAVYGGAATMASYSARASGDLRDAMGEDLVWLARLPWCVERTVGDRRYIVTHAGLHDGSCAQQLAGLADIDRWWAPDAGLPPDLYDKMRCTSIPYDLPDDSCVVSGHVPLLQPIVTEQRICCDTSGGLAARPLSAVIVPDMQVISSG